MNIPDLAYREGIDTAGSDVELFYHRARKIVAEGGEIEASAGAVLIGSLVQAQSYIFRTFVLADSLQALDGSIAEISLVMDNLEISE